MNIQPSLGLLDHLTHKANLKHTRFGWLRLTPAYSVHLVSSILDAHHDKQPVVLDPFCGTGTTSLVCAERGIKSDTTDINPFLIWLTRTKTRLYSQEEITDFEKQASDVSEAILGNSIVSSWIPPIHQVEKWWEEHALATLSRAMGIINAPHRNGYETTTDLLKVAFCRVMIEHSNASFGHQSMSFKKTNGDVIASLNDVNNQVADSWIKAIKVISQSASSPILQEPNAILCDARDLTDHLPDNQYSCVITSPPYPNRMSYIRELRPYMYWLGYLETGRDAGELDWKAIGGTWGCATSNVGKWQPEDGREIPHQGFYETLSNIAETSPLLSRYVHKYFHDMLYHAAGLFRVVRPGAEIHYIVGNSKFYDVMLPVEQIFSSIFKAAGFTKLDVRAIRKRTSKKELFEYMVSASKPNASILKVRQVPSKIAEFSLR